MRPFHAVLACCCLASANANANELLRVYELALANDTQIASAEHARDAAVEARPQARSYLLPQLSSSYQYLKGHEKGFQKFPTSIDTNRDGVVDTDIVVKTPADDSSKQETWGVTLNQVLFDWNAFKRYDQAGSQVALAEAHYRNAQQDLALRTAAAYFDLLASADSLRYTRAEKEAVDRQLDQAHRRFEVGLSAITDVQEAQARYDLTVAQEIQADQTLANSRQALMVITGPEALSKEVPLREEIPLTPPDPPSVERWVSAAGTNNLDLVASNLDAEIAGKDVDIARAGHYPTLGLIAEYQDQDQVQGQTEQSLHGPAVGAQLNLPIFSGFLVQSKIRQARAVEDQRKSDRLGVARDVERRTRDAYLAVMAGAARVKALKQAVVSNTTALEASQTGLEVGTRTAVDVLNAQSALYSAQRDYSRSRYDYLLAVLRLKAAAGSLDGKDLDEVDALLVQG